ncbi:hypothetical protein B0H10DRAFT_1941708 [Mycena sp. CBHHK59/15]|nr:hypothetical protein B0H10DRAFT_1941708 [Mycena sp. CBHHK59/15]
MRINELVWPGDGTREVWLAEEVLPPVEVVVCAPGRGMWLERTIMKEPEHGLQVGEAGVEQLAVEFAHILEGMFIGRGKSSSNFGDSSIKASQDLRQNRGILLGQAQFREKAMPFSCIIRSVHLRASLPEDKSELPIGLQPVNTENLVFQRDDLATHISGTSGFPCIVPEVFYDTGTDSMVVVAQAYGTSRSLDTCARLKRQAWPATIGIQ